MTQTIPPVRLDDLIAAVVSAHEDPLERVARAVALGMRLDDLADSLIDHFVDQARRSGASWTEIGRSLGVTKQAAQKRFSARQGPALDASQGFSRFTEQARRAVVAAQEEARNGRQRPNHRGPSHAGTAQQSRLWSGGVDRGPRDRPRPRAPDRARHLAAQRSECPRPRPLRPARPRRARSHLLRGRTCLVTSTWAPSTCCSAILAVEDGTGVLAGLGLRADEVEKGLGEQPH